MCAFLKERKNFSRKIKINDQKSIEHIVSNYLFFAVLFKCHFLPSEKNFGYAPVIMMLLKTSKTCVPTGWDGRQTLVEKRKGNDRNCL